ncbi:amino acid permease [Acetobacter conturbans]|uniref:Amino acid permease n=1 Tax=Acetobacter conturbans TaxID=1737472 RepID=A0ABX0JW63_9PROT|nr:amino acid permease [Acetobacter conturbans]NHN87524.1 amino acid permease [Acetobacter conturbans]
MQEVTGPTAGQDSVSQLKSRHVTMIALGGVIGAGLFVGSSAAIASCGPAVLLTFAFTGILVMGVMRMLGEMLIARPGLGSFIDYIREGCGPRASFMSAWLYWAFWVVTVGSEAIAGAIVLQNWFALPVWLMATLLVIAVVLINVTAVGIFGECEFWLSLIKVTCIIAFCAVACVYLTGILGGHPTPVKNFVGHGGFMPHGWAALLSILPTVLFSMVGSEIATVAAAESADATRSIAQVTRTIGTRISIFYIASLFLVLCVKPWDQIAPGQSPFVLAMEAMHIPGAPMIIRIVVLSAIVSCLNSSLYVTTRTLRGLAQRGEAPALLGVTAGNGTPRAAVLFSGLVGLLVAFSSILAPGTVFAFLLSATGGVMLFAYLFVVVAHLRLRRQAIASGASWPYVGVPFFPIANYLVIGAVLFVIAAMLVEPEQRSTVIASVGAFLVAAVAFNFVRRPDARKTVTPPLRMDTSTSPSR